MGEVLPDREKEGDRDRDPDPDREVLGDRAPDLG
jgi:hypothetical protein